MRTKIFKHDDGTFSVMLTPRRVTLLPPVSVLGATKEAVSKVILEVATAEEERLVELGLRVAK